MSRRSTGSRRDAPGCVLPPPTPHRCSPPHTALPVPRPAAAPPAMLLRWLLIALFALGTLVARTRGVCDQQCEAAGGSPRGGRPQRSRSRSPSPRRGGARQQPPRPLGSDPRLTMLAGVIASMITAAATLRWTPALARVRSQGAARRCVLPGPRWACWACPPVHVFPQRRPTPHHLQAQTLGGLASMCSMNALLLLMLVLVPGLAPAFYQRHAAWLLAATRWVGPLVHACPGCRGCLESMRSRRWVLPRAKPGSLVTGGSPAPRPPPRPQALLLCAAGAAGPAGCSARLPGEGDTAAGWTGGRLGTRQAAAEPAIAAAPLVASQWPACAPLALPHAVPAIGAPVWHHPRPVHA